MIQHNETKENPNYELNVSFIAAIKELDISGILSRCGIRKDSRKLKGESSDEKRTAFEIFQFLLLMVFQGCNLYRYLGSKKQDIACSKSTYHRFLGNEHYNWRRFITLLAAKLWSCWRLYLTMSLAKASGASTCLHSDGLSNGTIQMDEAVREEILDWYVSQPSFIRLICGKQLLETGLLTSANHKYGEMSTVA